MPDEPKKELILQVAAAKWPMARTFKVNQRQHTLSVFYPGKLRQFNFVIKADSHRELLAMVEACPDPKRQEVLPA